jgi:GWxTD domain-containing protein
VRPHPHHEVKTLRAAFAPLILALAFASAACGSWSRVGAPEGPAVPPERLPQIFDPTRQFREMGLFAESGPLPMIGSVRILAGTHADTQLAMVALSLRNRGITFRREGETFLGHYRVEIVARDQNDVAVRVARDEQVRVATFRETQRNDESVIFQQFLPLRQGSYTLSVAVRDVNGTGSARVELPIVVPNLAGASISLPIAVYEGRGRSALDQIPALVVNPRQAVGYGTDTLHFYVETYGVPAGTSIGASARLPDGRVAWSDTIVVSAVQPVQGHFLAIPPQQLSIGRYDLHVRLGPGAAAVMPFLVTFSDQYAVANLEEIVSLLRYFPEVDSLRALLNAPEEERAAAWQSFWRRSDPNPATPENEALDDYLARVQVANVRFREEGIPGWLTERGEVLIALGEPDEFVDRRADIQGRGRYIIWTYFQHRLTLTFVDDGGFGRFRLDPRSRAELYRVLNRLRRQ